MTDDDDSLLLGCGFIMGVVATTIAVLVYLIGDGHLSLVWQ